MTPIKCKDTKIRHNFNRIIVSQTRRLIKKNNLSSRVSSGGGGEVGASAPLGFFMGQLS